MQERPTNRLVSENPPGRRRFILIVCLCVATLFLLGLTQQRSLDKALEISGSLSEAMQNSLRGSLNSLKGPVRVGLQIGHLEPQEQPDELANLRGNTGGYLNGIREVDINIAVARMLHDMLENHGIEVDLIPATVPPNYSADLFISLHADSSPDRTRRGYKSAHFRTPRNAWEPVLKDHIDKAYFYFTGLPDDDENVSGAMLEYYGFNRNRFRHAVSNRTPAIIVEMGYLSNPDDLKIINDPVQPAYALQIGILSFLRERGRLSD